MSGWSVRSSRGTKELKEDRTTAEASISIADSGRGMSIDTLNNAVRAGWSSNDRFSKLGLFGMGFNIATARLGRVARVFTTRAQDLEWLGVEIDLDRIGDDFNVPLIRRTKTSPNEHGTVVEITRLEPSRAGWLGKNASKIRATLGDVYSHLLLNAPFGLYVDAVKVTPRRACVWDASRSVTYGSGSTAEQMPAIITIDERLPDAEACLQCGNWQPPELGTCAECGSTTLESKARHIHGWIGIQRHLHKTEFGIDFLRNGRKILCSASPCGAAARNHDDTLVWGRLSFSATAAWLRLSRPARSRMRSAMGARVGLTMRAESREVMLLV